MMNLKIVTGVIALFMFACAAGLPLGAQVPQRILETTQPPSDIERSNPGWAGDVCGGKTALTPGGARYEWTPVIPGYGQYGSVEPASGWALADHPSDTDVPFTHPFGKVDFDYLLLPDALFNGLLAPSNATDGDKEHVEARADAASRNLTVGAGGLLAVEQEVGLIPEEYRPKTGDRVTVFGRWIIDCGHDNWETEIHPPLLTVVAHPDAGKQLTRVTLIANPYLVDQEFSHGGIMDQLATELALVASPLPFIPFNDQVKAQPSILPPSHGMVVFSFKIRPPAPSPSPNQLLYLRMHLTARPGVVVQPFWVDDETVGVVGLFTDSLTMPPVTGTTDWNVSGDELQKLNKDVGLACQAMIVQIGAGLADPFKAAVLARGILGILYPAPVPPDLTNAQVTEGWTRTNPWGQNPVNVNASQAFPLIGWMEVQWRVPASVPGSLVDTNAWKAVESHLSEYVGSGPSGKRDVIARSRATSALLTDPRPPVSDGVTGKWHYMIKGGNQPTEQGSLALRINGTAVQGLIEREGHAQVMLSGELTDGGKGMLLTTVNVKGSPLRLRLKKKSSTFAGTVVGTNKEVELDPQE
jgi:hypothetical protein